MTDNVKGPDHGLGVEVVDPTTAISDTYVVESEAKRVEARQEAGIGYWVVATAVLVLLGEQTVLAFVLFTPVLSKIAIEFQTADVVWILTVFTLASAVLSPLMTKIGDRYGKRRTMLAGAAVTALGSLIAALAPNFTVLLAGRVLMAASAAFLPLTVALMREVFPTRMRAVAIGLATNGFGVMVVGGPVLAGLLTETWGVRSVFVFNLIIAVVVPIFVWLLVPESPIRARVRIDYGSAALIGVGSFGVLIGLTQLATLGFGLVTGVCLVVGVVALVMWWLRLGRIPEPLISVVLMSKRTIMLPVLAFLAYTGVSGAMNIIVALHWATPADTGYGHGLTSLQVGWWSAPAGVISVLAGVFVGLTAKSVGYRTHMLIAGVFWVVPSIILGLNLSASPALIIIVYGLYGIANMQTAAAMCLVLLAAPGDQRGVALGMKSAIAGIAGAAFSQLISVILRGSIVGEQQGAPLYSATGFTVVYLVAAVIGFAGLVASVFIPQGRRIPRREREVSMVAMAPSPAAPAQSTQLSKES